jgi:hypothetical protein
MSLDVESIIQVANELKEAQERVRFLERKLGDLTNTARGNALTGGPPTMSSLSELVAIASLPDKVIKFLDGNPDRIFSFGEIHEFVGGAENYLRSTLARLIKEERIASRGWGKYGSAETKSLLQQAKERAQNL